MWTLVVVEMILKLLNELFCIKRDEKELKVV